MRKRSESDSAMGWQPCWIRQKRNCIRHSIQQLECITKLHAFINLFRTYYTQCTVKLRPNFEKIAQLKCTTNEKRNLSEHDEKNFKWKIFSWFIEFFSRFDILVYLSGWNCLKMTQKVPIDKLIKSIYFLA